MNKNTQTFLINKWLEFIFNIENLILLEDHIINAINLFHEQVLSKLEQDTYILIIFRIKTSDNLIRNISTVHRIKNSDSDYEKLIENFTEFWNIKSSEYILYSISEIIFSSKIIDNSHNIIESKINSPISNRIEKMKNLLTLGGFNFPTTMNLYEWGDVQFLNKDKNAIVYKNNSKAEYHITFDRAPY